jgi:hypothetical protein
MKRTKALRLVLMGGGIAVMLAACGDNDARRRECEQARAQLRPDAEQICARSSARSSSTGSRGSSWFFGRSAGTSDGGRSSATSTAPSSRGGFGSSASSSGS